MIYVTGDYHGGWDKAKFTNFDNSLPKEGDYLIICGDFGCVWYPEDNEYHYCDIEEQNWFAAQPWTTLFVDGNHENFDILNTYPIEEWNGGKIHKINDKVIHLMRGQVFTIEGQKIFTMGGAESHDKEIRIEFVNWWRQEMPNKAEMDAALNELEKNSWKVDYVITHTQPSYITKKIVPPSTCNPNSLMTFFDYIKDILDYKHWYSGHLHEDKTIGDITVLYNKIIPLGSTITD